VGHCRDAASHAALEVAANLAVRLHAELHVVHCIDLSDYPIHPDAHDWEAQAQAHLPRNSARFDKSSSSIQGDGPTTPRTAILSRCSLRSPRSMTRCSSW
jgi:nucleotide-binding universal stress UspA family protein